MDNKTFLEILKSESMIFTTKELQQIIDEELDREPEKMDIELIEACLDALDGKFDEVQPQQNKKRKIKLSKALLIAAIVIIILSIAVPVGAKYLNINVSNNIVEYKNDYFDVDLKKAANCTQEDISNAFDEESYFLPAVIFNSEYEIYGLNINDNHNMKSITFNFTNSTSNVQGIVVADTYNDKCDFSDGSIKASKNFDNVEELIINNNNIVVFSVDNECLIYYVYENYEYNVSIDCDIETAKEIACSLEAFYEKTN